MTFNDLMFTIVLAASMIGALFWSAKIQPKRGGILPYIIWLLLVNTISLIAFNPWNVLGQG